jgi:energy-converting hydrogenase B subunit D
VTAIQAIALLLVAAGGLAVVLIRDPMRQALGVGLYGMLLAVLFLAFQAPDVALSITGAGAVALPLMIVLALLKTRQR